MKLFKLSTVLLLLSSNIVNAKLINIEYAVNIDTSTHRTNQSNAWNEPIPLDFYSDESELSVISNTTYNLNLYVDTSLQGYRTQWNRSEHHPAAVSFDIPDVTHSDGSTYDYSYAKIISSDFDHLYTQSRNYYESFSSSKSSSLSSVHTRLEQFRFALADSMVLSKNYYSGLDNYNSLQVGDEFGLTFSRRTDTLYSATNFAGDEQFSPLNEFLRGEATITNFSVRDAVILSNSLLDVLEPNGGSGGLSVSLQNGSNSTGEELEASYSEVLLEGLDFSEYVFSDVNFALPTSTLQLWDLSYDGIINEDEMVELVFSFDPSNMTTEELAALDIYHYEDDVWTALGGVVDLNNNTITAFTSSFSPFAIGLNANVVPEPSTLAIFSLGMIALASRRFKNQN